MKNKEITIYELMGLIKEGKAPKKVKYNGATYEYDGEDYYLETSHDYENFSLFDRLQNSNTIKGLLTLAVEILPEENDEWEDIEELCNLKTHEYNTTSVQANRIAINQLIKNQKYLKEKLENKDEN